jgi:hypothetical protein
MTAAEPAKWRVVETDTESPSGVAPVCDKPTEHAEWTTQSSLTNTRPDSPDTYDCCPGPFIECWSPHTAKQIAAALNAAYAEVCS